MKDLMQYYFSADHTGDFKSLVRDIDRQKRVDGEERECVKWQTKDNQKRRSK